MCFWSVHKILNLKIKENKFQYIVDQLLKRQANSQLF